MSVSTGISPRYVRALVKIIKDNPGRTDLIEDAQKLLVATDKIPNKDPELIEALNELRQVIA